MTDRARVLVAADGDADPTGVAVSRALRDAGVEVVYTSGPHSAAELVQSALQEDVDAIALPADRHADVRDALAGQGADDVVLVAANDLLGGDIQVWLREAHVG
jgi:methylmalonyl-CoA mutase cobalamin-binding domain/chain